MGAQTFEQTCDAAVTIRAGAVAVRWRMVAVAVLCLAVGIAIGRLWDTPVTAGSRAAVGADVDWSKAGLDPAIEVRPQSPRSRRMKPQYHRDHPHLAR